MNDYPVIKPELSIDPFMAKLFGPKIDIYVGEEPGKKYTVPRDLLCYYSDDFNDRYNLNKPEEPVYYPEEKPEQFDRLMRWMLREESIEFGWIDKCDLIKECMKFIAFAQRMDLPNACMAVNNAVQRWLVDVTPLAVKGEHCGLEDDHIRLVYDFIARGHPIRTAITRFAMKDFLPGEYGVFKHLLDEIDQFAADIVRQLSSSLLTAVVSTEDGKEGPTYQNEMYLD